jgi:hypothetical protein
LLGKYTRELKIKQHQPVNVARKQTQTNLYYEKQKDINHNPYYKKTKEAK